MGGGHLAEEKDQTGSAIPVQILLIGDRWYAQEKCQYWADMESLPRTGHRASALCGFVGQLFL
jgi:hypothetical protein